MCFIVRCRTLGITRAGQPTSLCCGAVRAESEREQCHSLTPLYAHFPKNSPVRWEFLPPLQPPQYFIAVGFESLVSLSARSSSPLQAAALLRVLSTWLPWLSEICAVWFSGSSSCLLFLNWLWSLFWLCKEAQRFFLPLHLGQNSQVPPFIYSFFYLSHLSRLTPREFSE